MKFGFRCFIGAVAMLAAITSSAAGAYTPGYIYTVAGTGAIGYAGDGGPATAARVDPSGVAVDSTGNLYIADNYNSRIRKVATDGTITTVAGTGTSGYTGDGGPATAAKIGSKGIAVDGAGNLYIVDGFYHVIRKVTASTGIITTVAGTGKWGYTGDNLSATSTALDSPSGIAIDGTGNLYIADRNNSIIRKVTASTGIITTVVGTPPTISTYKTTGHSGYSGDNDLATKAQLNGPSGIAIDGAGNLYIADINNHRIRKVTASTGIITTVAGSGGNGSYGAYSGDNGPAIVAKAPQKKAA